jgi:hypothetical protein
MLIEMKEVACLFECTKELAVLIQDNHMAQPKSQLNLHYCGCIILRVCMFDRFHDGKSCHTTTGDKACFIAFKTGMIASLVCIHKQNAKGRFD